MKAKAKDLTIIPPEGYEIDEEKSTFSKIVFKEKATTLRRAVDELGWNYNGVVEIEDRHIKFPLPNCNKEWTFSVFDAVQKFCKKHIDCYPEHSSEFDAHYLYINCDCSEFFSD